MAWNQALRQLRDVLADLYPHEEDARVVAMDAGLETTLIAFSDMAVTNWTNILVTAHNNKQVEDLIKVAQNRFPRNSKLAAAAEAYRTAKSEETPRSSEAVAVDKPSLRNAMVKAFSTEELEILCADLQFSLAQKGIEEQLNLETVGGSTKALRVQNLIEHLDRRGHLAELIQAVRKERPEIAF